MDRHTSVVPAVDWYLHEFSAVEEPELVIGPRQPVIAWLVEFDSYAKVETTPLLASGEPARPFFIWNGRGSGAAYVFPGGDLFDEEEDAAVSIRKWWEAERTEHLRKLGLQATVTLPAGPVCGPGDPYDPDRWPGGGA